jgi:hypothetical protein
MHRSQLLKLLPSLAMAKSVQRKITDFAQPLRGYLLVPCRCCYCYLTPFARVLKPVAINPVTLKSSFKKTSSRAALGQVDKRAGISNSTAIESAVVSQIGMLNLYWHRYYSQTFIGRGVPGRNSADATSGRHGRGTVCRPPGRAVCNSFLSAELLQPSHNEARVVEKIQEFQASDLCM